MGTMLHHSLTLKVFPTSMLYKIMLHLLPSLRQGRRAASLIRAGCTLAEAVFMNGSRSDEGRLEIRQLVSP